MNSFRKQIKLKLRIIFTNIEAGHSIHSLAGLAHFQNIFERKIVENVLATVTNQFQMRRWFLLSIIFSSNISVSTGADVLILIWLFHDFGKFTKNSAVNLKLKSKISEMIQKKWKSFVSILKILTSNMICSFLYYWSFGFERKYSSKFQC